MAEKKYIEHEKALDAISGWLMKAIHTENMSSYNEGERAAYRTAISEIAAIPAADVRPVVLCKVCKHFCEDVWAEYAGVPIIVAHEICRFWAGGSKTDPEGFCFAGEKREADTLTKNG